MPSIQLLLAFADQTFSFNAAGAQRSLTFLGSVHGDDALSVTRDAAEFDARRSQWIVKIFDAQEQPLTDFYVERATERNIKCLAAAIYLQPNEYAESEQPEIDVYVWLPPSAFESICNIAPALQSVGLQAVLDLTAPFRGSELHYSSGDPETYDKVWRAENENPLLLEGTEFHIFPIKRSDLE